MYVESYKFVRAISLGGIISQAPRCLLCQSIERSQVPIRLPSIT